MKERLPREVVAMRVAKEFFDGAVVNLGIGIPTLCANYIPPGIDVIFHTQNGALGFGPILTEDEIDKADINLINAGGQFISGKPGMSFFDHATSFGMIRGGYIDITVLGALEVSGKGDLANWFNPKRGVGNIGGGMDLAFNAKKVIVAMEHTTKDGKPKIVNECSLPLTAPRCVKMIVTDIAVIEIKDEKPILKEVAPGWTPEEVQALTEPELIIAPDLKEIELA